MREQLEVAESWSQGVDARVLVVRGELDLLTAPQLADAFERACREGASKVVVDLRGLEFIDSTGVRALGAGCQLCASRGSPAFLIRGANRQVRKVLAISGFDDEHPLFPELPVDELARLYDPRDDPDPTLA